MAEDHRDRLTQDFTKKIPKDLEGGLGQVFKNQFCIDVDGDVTPVEAAEAFSKLAAKMIKQGHLPDNVSPSDKADIAGQLKEVLGNDVFKNMSAEEQDAWTTFIGSPEDVKNAAIPTAFGDKGMCTAFVDPTTGEAYIAGGDYDTATETQAYVEVPANIYQTPDDLG